ncbi:MAG: penicillin acylase family protein, partial [Pseudomonadota bacterium]
MAVLFRWLFRLAAGLVALIVLAVLMVYYLAAQSLPDYDRDVAVQGLSAPVEIVRDNANVPHIFAQSDPDVFFGLGYAHAQDRLWQMVTMRRLVQGRLSEVFGARTVETDKTMRRFDMYRLASDSVPDQDPWTQAVLEAYAAGVNARLDEINERALGRGAPEMFLFRVPVAPWQPADSIAVIKLMGLMLSGQMQNEILRARTLLMLDDTERLADIMPDAPGTGIAALPEYASLFPEVPRYAADTATDYGRLSPFPKPGLAGASNAWTAAPSR